MAAPHPGPMPPTHDPNWHTWLAAYKAWKAEKEAQERSESDQAFVRGAAREGFGQSRNRQAPQMPGTTIGPVQTGSAATIDPTQQAQFRQHQLDLARRLAGIESGDVMGAGQLGAQRATQRALASQHALARMGRGANAANAARSAARNLVDVGQQGMATQAQAALSDQAAARGVLSGLLSSGRGQDIGLATAGANLQQQMNLANLSAENQRIFKQAGLDQATSMANMQSKLTQMGMDDRAALQYLQLLFGMSEADIKRRLAEEANQTTFGDVLQAGGKIAGGLGFGLSDKRAKTDIKGSAAPIRKALDNLSPATFRYKPQSQKLEGGGEAVDLSDLPPQVQRDILEGRVRLEDIKTTPHGASPRPAPGPSKFRRSGPGGHGMSGLSGLLSQAGGGIGTTPRAGVMAQDLERSELGRDMVQDIGGQKHIDNNKAVGLALAGLADMHERLKKLGA